MPDEVVQVTALFDAEPATVAANEIVPPVLVEVLPGETVTEVTDGLFGGVGAAVTVIVAAATLLGSASLTAVTIDVPAADGAV